MKTYIEEHIQNCDKCFEHKPKLLTARPELHPIPVIQSHLKPGV